MPPRIAKKAVSCPACGASQEESIGVISTYCRTCSHHFEIAPEQEQKPARATEPSTKSASWQHHLAPWTARLAPLQEWSLRLAEPWILRYEPQLDKIRIWYHRWRPPEFKSIRCHECGRVHQVPWTAVSTTCPNCNAHVELKDYTIDKRTSQVVRTRGHLVIKKFGYLNNQITICGHADIGGGAGGKLFCDGETLIRTTGRLNCEIGSRRVRIEKGADVIVAQPIRVHDMVVRGKITARIYCNGTLRVLKRGYLRGEVHARSIMVDKGGLMQAELNVGRFDEVNPKILGSLQERTCYMALEEAVLPQQQATLQI
jgi:cytoskeletal protein CcmA (bactofilin family)